MRRALALLSLLLGFTLFAAHPASAAVAASVENRASGSASVANNLVGSEVRLSEEAVRENILPAYDLASDDAIAARGGAEIIASNGTRIAGFTRHGINRAIGDAASRAGTKPQAILDALKNPAKIAEGVDKQGRPFQIFTGGNARVVVNPETGQIVSVNPLSRLGAQ